MSASSIWTNLFPPSPQWSIEQITDLSGKIMMVTGGTGGIGKETAKVLLIKNAKIYIAARSQEKGDAAVVDLENLTGKTAIFLKVDLGNLRSIKAAAAEYLSKDNRLDVLFNSGGVMHPPIEDITSDGYDLQFGTNTLGHFYLTKLLLPALLTVASSSQKARVINVSSMGHMFHPGDGIVFDSLKDGPQRRKLTTYQLYGQSKFGNVVFSNELARRYGDQGIVSISLHPGNLQTDLQRNASQVQRCLTSWMLYPAPMGALTQLYAGTSPEALNLNGQYLLPWARLGKPHENTNNTELAGKLWEWMEEQLKEV